jgi:hypothetical protein
MNSTDSDDMKKFTDADKEHKRLLKKLDASHAHVPALVPSAVPSYGIWSGLSNAASAVASFWTRPTPTQHVDEGLDKWVDNDDFTSVPTIFSKELDPSKKVQSNEWNKRYVMKLLEEKYGTDLTHKPQRDFQFECIMFNLSQLRDDEFISRMRIKPTTIEAFYRELNKEIDEVHLSERLVRKTVFRKCTGKKQSKRTKKYKLKKVKKNKPNNKNKKRSKSQ